MWSGCPNRCYSIEIDGIEQTTAGSAQSKLDSVLDEVHGVRVTHADVGPVA